jgi:hypothetical protein
MPLPWTFARNSLVPVRPNGERAYFHVRTYTDRWAGSVVLVGELADQPSTVAEALPALCSRLCRSWPVDRVRLMSYRPGDPDLFRDHADPDDSIGLPEPSFVTGELPRDRSAVAVRTIRCGPRVDVWERSAYRLETLHAASRNEGSTAACAVDGVPQ